MKSHGESLKPTPGNVPMGSRRLLAVATLVCFSVVRSLSESNPPGPVGYNFLNYSMAVDRLLESGGMSSLPLQAGS